MATSYWLLLVRGVIEGEGLEALNYSHHLLRVRQLLVNQCGFSPHVAVVAFLTHRSNDM